MLKDFISIEAQRLECCSHAFHVMKNNAVLLIWRVRNEQKRM